MAYHVLYATVVPCGVPKGMYPDGNSPKASDSLPLIPALWFDKAHRPELAEGKVKAFWVLGNFYKNLLLLKALFDSSCL